MKFLLKDLHFFFFFFFLGSFLFIDVKGRIRPLWACDNRFSVINLILYQLPNRVLIGRF